MEEQEYQTMRREEVEKIIEGSHLLQYKYFDEDTRDAMPAWVKQQWMIKECVEERISVATVIDRWKCGLEKELVESGFLKLNSCSGKEDEEDMVKMVDFVEKSPCSNVLTISTLLDQNVFKRRRRWNYLSSSWNWQDLMSF